MRCDEPVEAGALALAEVPLTDADAGATNKVRGPVCDLDEAAGASVVGSTGLTSNRSVCSTPVSGIAPATPRPTPTRAIVID